MRGVRGKWRAIDRQRDGERARETRPVQTYVREGEVEESARDRGGKEEEKDEKEEDDEAEEGDAKIGGLPLGDHPRPTSGAPPPSPRPSDPAARFSTHPTSDPRTEDKNQYERVAISL